MKDKTINVESLLEHVAALRAKLAEEDAAHEREMKVIMRPVRSKVNECLEAHEARVAKIRARLDAEEEHVKEQVVAIGATVKAEGIMAVYIKPRVSWDGAKLEGMMALVPGLEKARTVAESGTCQLRTIKD